MDKNRIEGLVSIIVPVYNKKTYIETCLKNIARQSYTRFEVIIVDDGSTDGSSTLCDRYAKEYNWLKVIHTSNHGVSAARNTGMEISKGEWISFVDVDDYPLPSMLEVMVKEDASLVVCNWKSEKKPVCSRKFKKERQICNIVDDNELLMCTPDFFKNVWNKLFRSDIIINHNIRYEEKLCHAEDALFVIDYFSVLEQRDKIVLLSAPLYFHLSDVQGSLVKDKHPERWRTSAKYWWKHVEKAKVSELSKQSMLLRCLQNEFLVCAMYKDINGIKMLLKTKGHLITKGSVKYWSILKRLVLLSRNAYIIYFANRYWLKIF